MDKRTVVTAHDAFSYLAADYRISQFAPQSSTLGFGGSAQRLAKLIDRVRRDNIRAIFLENTGDPRLLEQVSAETGVAIGGYLYSDALSEQGGDAATYLDLMRHNLDTVLAALRKSN